MVALNENINIVDILKDDLRQPWTYRYKAWAERWLHRWVDWALETTIYPLRRFAKGLLRNKEKILNDCKHPVTNGRLESFNNTVARVLDRTCGVENIRYLTLKLDQESLLNLQK